MNIIILFNINIYNGVCNQNWNSICDAVTAFLCISSLAIMVDMYLGYVCIKHESHSRDYYLLYCVSYSFYYYMPLTRTCIYDVFNVSLYNLLYVLAVS